MSLTLLLVPTNAGVGLSTVTLGLQYAFQEQGVAVQCFKPIEQNKMLPCDEHSLSIPVQRVEQLLSAGGLDDLLEEILNNYQRLSEGVDIVLVQGLIVSSQQNYTAQLNVSLAAALDAQVVIVSTPANYSVSEQVGQIEITARYFGGINHSRVLGCIINKINGPEIKGVNARLDLGYLYQANSPKEVDVQQYQTTELFQHPSFQLLGCIPWNPEIIAPRIKDLVTFLNATIINAGEMTQRRVHYITLCARSINNITASLLPGTLIITPGDRSDIICATCIAVLNGVKIAGLLLTGDFDPDANIMTLCAQALATGLPVFAVSENSFRTAVMLHDLTLEIPSDDSVRIAKIQDFVASHLNRDWIKNFITCPYERHLSPPAFRYQLATMAKKANKKIVLPEGAEPRTIAAAAICVERGFAHCVLLGKSEEILRVAEYNGIKLPEELTIVDPEAIAPNFISPLVALRKEKGMTALAAQNYLQDPVVVGTMMLMQDQVDGLVSGALHTTANTIRPALQLIKTAPGVHLVSSVFFMCLANQVLLFADCAVNPDPNVEQLADIAIQTADTAKAFGIPQRIAMISYSTGESGSGQDVDKVRAATMLVKKLRPDLLVDGPLQYDAALIPEVAKTKAPDSLVAGKATVFIFPDLNTGNTTYKAVQRSADVLCVGPMLQGLHKPVNDLSRGASIDDIVYTIALTAIQASLS